MKNWKIVLFLLAFCLSVGGLRAQQMDLFGKKEDLKDINHRILMVVSENNSLIDMALKDAVQKRWKLSKFDFCGPEEFGRLQGDTSYYFLVRVKGLFKKEREPGLEFLSLLKGGPEGVRGVDEMYEAVAMPLQSLEDGDGEIASYMEAYVNIFQSYVLRVQRNKMAARLGLAWYADRIPELEGRTLLFREDDLSPEVVPEGVAGMFYGKARVDDDAVEEALEEGRARTVVSLTVSPTSEQQDSYSYKMLIGADTKELFYFRRQKIGIKAPKGFLKNELKKIAVPFK